MKTAVPTEKDPFFNLAPRPEGPTSQSDSTELAEVLRRGWFFGVTYHNMGARHSVSDGGLGYCL